MITRAVFALLILPGVFAGLIPALAVSMDRNRGGGWVGGYLALAFGLILLLWCVRDFFVSGRGTLAPWDPPKRLVVVGLYRFVRNPMYVAILLLLFGWSVAAGSWVLAAYGALLGLAFHLRVILYEEPTLQRQFGPEWVHYASRVPRWWPHFRRAI